MVTYVVLINWTEQGIADAQKSPNRASEVASSIKKMGGRMREVYWTIGQYDAVSIVDAPDDETFTAWAVSVGAQGNVRTTSMRAFDKKAMGEILAKMP
jgi:uncharacterized protein with GYD domain